MMPRVLTACTRSIYFYSPLRQGTTFPKYPYIMVKFCGEILITEFLLDLDNVLPRVQPGRLL